MSCPEFATQDNLAYNYGTGGNRLMKVTDTGDPTSGFTDGNLTGDDYLYDANGNMNVDKNKNINSPQSLRVMGSVAADSAANFCGRHSQ